MSGTKMGSQERRKPRPEDFVFGKMIGEGSFSCVFLARNADAAAKATTSAVDGSVLPPEHQPTFREFAIKVCEKAKIKKEGKEKYVFREKDVMATITHHFNQKVPFFVQLHSTFQDARNFYFCMTYAKNGDIFRFIEKMAENDIDCVQFYAAELLAAVEFLHFTVGVIHRDLKPENILLDEKMHILITDFGSAKFIKQKYNVHNGGGGNSNGGSRTVGPTEDSSESSDEEDCCREVSVPLSSRRPPRDDDDVDNVDMVRPKRKSFVGTAQYVSPEILRSAGSTRASDLWAIGCIIYQMITGRPPFLSSSEWLIFKKIEKLEYGFQEGFNESAKDLIRRLLVIDPSERIGARDRGEYRLLKSHIFFEGVDFEALPKTTPPPDVVQELYGCSDAPDPIWAKDPNAKPGADRLPMLMLRDAGCGSSSNDSLSNDPSSNPIGVSASSKGSPAAAAAAGGNNNSSTDVNNVSRITKSNLSKNLVLQSQNLSASERRTLLSEQKSNKYHRFVENNLILKQGVLDKKKGLLARRRVFLLTEGPRLYYVDPDKMTLKGQIPLSESVRTVIRDPRIFFLHTPNRVYYLLDPVSNAQEWCLAVEEIRDRYFGTTKEDEAKAATKVTSSSQ